MAQPRLVTFDVYSALLDIQGGLVALLSDVTGRDADAVRPLAMTWRVKQMERAAASNSLGGERLSFRACTRLALDYVCARFDLAVSAATREDMVFAWDRLPLWPEADDAVAAVKAMGCQTAILSNGDQDMLDAVARLFSAGFDHVLSSETAGYYKPHPSNYALPEKLLGIASSDTLHVAGGHTDVTGAIAYGLPCVWSNKTGDSLLDPTFPPDAELKDLSELAGWIAAN